MKCLICNVKEKFKGTIYNAIIDVWLSCWPINKMTRWGFLLVETENTVSSERKVMLTQMSWTTTKTQFAAIAYNGGDFMKWVYYILSLRLITAINNVFKFLKVCFDEWPCYNMPPCGLKCFYKRTINQYKILSVMKSILFKFYKQEAYRLKDHVSIRYSTLTSCQKGSYMRINKPIIELINLQ